MFLNSFDKHFRQWFGTLFFILTITLVNTGVASTLQTVQDRGHLICGIDQDHFAFAHLNDQGDWQGFETDFCRAIAAAVLNNPERTKFVPLNAQTRFTALRDNKIDVLLRSTTWTFKRDVTYGFDFPIITYYDRMGALAHKKLGLKKFEEFAHGTLCVANATTTLETIRSIFREEKKDVIIKVFNSRDGLNTFFFSGQCDLYVSDHSALIAALHMNAPRLEDYVFLETNFTKEPLGPVVRETDRQWYEIVKWVINGLIEAEELGLTQEAVENYTSGKNQHHDFLFGYKPGLGTPLGLNDQWLYQVLLSTGHYGEIFERNMGQNSRFKLERGQNALWRDGGLHYAIPMR